MKTNGPDADVAYQCNTTCKLFGLVEVCTLPSAILVTLAEGFGEGIAFGSVCLLLGQMFFFFDKYVDRLSLFVCVLVCLFVCPHASSPNRSTDYSEIFRD